MISNMFSLSTASSNAEKCVELKEKLKKRGYIVADGIERIKDGCLLDLICIYTAIKYDDPNSTEKLEEIYELAFEYGFCCDKNNGNDIVSFRNLAGNVEHCFVKDGRNCVDTTMYYIFTNRSQTADLVYDDKLKASSDMVTLVLGLLSKNTNNYHAELVQREFMNGELQEETVLLTINT